MLMKKLLLDISFPEHIKTRITVNLHTHEPKNTSSRNFSPT